jgi:hypothetical protein
VCSLYINIWRTLEKERNIIFHYIIAKGRSRNLEYCFLLIAFYLPKSKTIRAWIVLYSASTTKMSMTKMYTKKNIWINWCLCAICLAFRYLNILFYRRKTEYYYERTKMHFFVLKIVSKICFLIWIIYLFILNRQTSWEPIESLPCYFILFLLSYFFYFSI